MKNEIKLYNHANLDVEQRNKYSYNSWLAIAASGPAANNNAYSHSRYINAGTPLKKAIDCS